MRLENFGFLFALATTDFFAILFFYSEVIYYDIFLFFSTVLSKGSPSSR